MAEGEGRSLLSLWTYYDFLRGVISRRSHHSAARMCAGAAQV